MKMDAHQHFWRIARGDYRWLTPDRAALYRDFLPNDLAPLLAAHGIGGTILVQAAPTIAETEFMLSLADTNPFIKGVVGWVDFEAADAPDQIARLGAHPGLVGLRPMIQGIANPDWMLGPGLEPAFQALQGFNLTFDALTLPHHLPNLLTLQHRRPDMRLVINHASKPAIRAGDIAVWAADMSLIASETQAYCKLSGLAMVASENWRTNDLRPYVDHLLSTFGPERLIWGSDWPICTLACSYDRWVETTAELLADVSITDRSAILGGNAATAYRL